MQEKVKILVVEDEIIIADDLCDTLTELGYEVPEPAIDYNEAIEAFEREQPDLAILDIRLAGQRSGLEVADKINTTYHFPFIFLTSNSDAATLAEAKLCRPSAFLAKPFRQSDLHASIEIALFNYSEQEQKALDHDNLIIKDALYIKQNKIFLRIKFDDILYLESDHVYLDIHLVNGKKYSVRGNLNEFVEKLSAKFIRSHRSYIINLTHLEGINHAYTIISGKEIPLGKRYRKIILSKVKTG